jgi:hypothetical protein
MFDVATSMEAGNAGAASWHTGETLALAFCPSGGSLNGAKRANGPPSVFVLRMNPS